MPRARITVLKRTLQADILEQEIGDEGFKLSAYLRLSTATDPILATRAVKADASYQKVLRILIILNFIFLKKAFGDAFV